MTVHIFPLQAVASPTAETAAFNYVISLLPQLITILAAIMAGFKFLQKGNEKKIEETKNEIMAKFDVERDFISKDIKAIYTGINNLDSQNKTIVGFIKDELARHEKMLDRLGDSRT
jgi:hypothetical protein